MKTEINNIPCTVGILTYNSEKNLRRALDSVKDFDEIVISDGGSTDQTLQIAAEYGAKVIKQLAVANPSGVDFHPISNFAAERNHILEAASQDWFFWLDSDEYISQQLHEEIKVVCRAPNPEHKVYEIERIIQSPDGLISYNRTKPVFQVRLFNRSVNAHYIKSMHERIFYDEKKYSLGRLNNGWFVPISKPKFSDYKRVVLYRLRVMLANQGPYTLVYVWEKGIVAPCKGVLSAVYRCLGTRIFFFRRQPMPMYYYLYQLYSQWIIATTVLSLYIKAKR